MKKLIIFCLLTMLVCASLGCNGKVNHSNPVSDNNNRVDTSSFKMIDDFPLYTFNYAGDYYLDEFLSQGAKSDRELYEFLSAKKLSPHLNILSTRDEVLACSCFTGLNSKTDKIFGRNFDFPKNPGLLLFTNPKNGYASVSMVDAFFLGLKAGQKDWDPQYLLAAPYAPVDGMNEYGLTVGVMAVDYDENKIDPHKKTLPITTIVRMLLDKTKNIKEAVALLRNYNMGMQCGFAVHFLIGDATGGSVVVEFLDTGMVTLYKENKPYQAAENFLFSTTAQNDYGARYNLMRDYLELLEGKVNEVSAMTLLDLVSQDSTQNGTLWSVVYNMTEKKMSIVMGRKYRSENIIMADVYGLKKAK